MQNILLQKMSECKNVLLAEANTALTHNEKEVQTLLLDSFKFKKQYDRALLMRVCYEQFNNDWQKISKSLLAIELYDLSLIVIDDFFDNQKRRMNSLTYFQSYGASIATIIGILLKSISDRLMYEDFNTFNPSKFKELTKRIEEAHSNIYYGQYLDLTYENKPISAISIEDYVKMVGLTTGEEIMLACEFGAWFAGCNESQIKHYAEVGFRLGTLFQFRDDFIDYIDDEEGIGKSPYNDVLNFKKRLPVILLYKYSDVKNKNKLEKIYKSRKISKSDIKYIKSLFEHINIYDKIEMEFGVYYSETKDMVNKLGNKDLINIYNYVDIGDHY